MADIIDMAQDRAEELLQDAVGNIRAEVRRPGVVDGFCEDCDCLIPEKRLKAAPWAKRCVACQEEYEAEFKAGSGR
jgi:phage/conjugal plasmid C-4 type zinc finger TraR family protein